MRSRSVRGSRLVVIAVSGAVVLLGLLAGYVLRAAADGTASPRKSGAAAPAGDDRAAGRRSREPAGAMPGLPAGTPPGEAPGDGDEASPDESSEESSETPTGTRGSKDFRPPEPPAAAERADERRRMVRAQVARPSDRRDAVRSGPVLAAMRTVPRHVFVPARVRDRAYDDTPLPIGHGQTISQPYIVAWMTQLLELEPGDRVLEIGTGSGYQAAVLAHITPHVHTVEIVEPLAERAAKVLREQGYDDVETRRADGYHGWEEHAPYDAIIVTCAAGHLPPPLWKQLAPGGRIVIPIGGPYALQRLVVVSKTEDGKRRSRAVAHVRFVPLTRGEEGSDGG